jgi:hypothetical protein
VFAFMFPRRPGAGEPIPEKLTAAAFFCLMTVRGYGFDEAALRAAVCVHGPELHPTRRT